MPRINQLLAEAQRSISHVGKGGINTGQNYRYRRIEDIMDAVSEVFAKLGIGVRLRVLKTIRETQALPPRSNNEPARQVHFVYHRVEYKFVAAEDDSEAVVVVDAIASNNDDKAGNKAMTAAFKIALSQVLIIPFSDVCRDSEDDSDDDDRGRPLPSMPQSRPEQRPEPKYAPSPDPPKPVPVRGRPPKPVPEYAKAPIQAVATPAPIVSAPTSATLEGFAADIKPDQADWIALNVWGMTIKEIQASKQNLELWEAWKKLVKCIGRHPEKPKVRDMASAVVKTLPEKWSYYQLTVDNIMAIIDRLEAEIAFLGEGEK